MLMLYQHPHLSVWQEGSIYHREEYFVQLLGILGSER